MRLEHDVEAQKVRALEAERALHSEEERAKHLRDEVAKGRKALEALKLAAGQEAKRAQLKADKLKDQLARAIPIAPPSFELLNPVPRGAVAPRAPGPIPLLESGLRDLADLRASLQEEVEAFRHVVLAAANGLNEAIAAGEGRDAPRLLLPTEFFQAGRQSSWTAHPAIADAKLRALVADARALLTAEISPAVRDGSGETEAEAEEHELRARAERERLKAEADLRDRVKDLEVEIAISRGREEEARKVAEEVAKLNVHGRCVTQRRTLLSSPILRGMLADSSVPSTTDFEDSRLRDELVRQKRVLDAERTALRDEGVRLQEERMAFEAERVAALEAVRRAEEAAREAEEARAAQVAREDEIRSERAAGEAAVEAAAVDIHRSGNADKASGTISTSSSSTSLSSSSSSSAQPRPRPPAAPVTPRKHVPSRPSPLSPHHNRGARKTTTQQASPAKPKPKLHVAKRPRASLARAVMDRQHRRSVEATASPRVASAGKRSASLGSSSSARSSSLSAGPSTEAGEEVAATGAEKAVSEKGKGRPPSQSRSVAGGSEKSAKVLGEGGKRGNQAGPAASAPPRKPLTAGTAASMARSAKKPEGALKSEGVKKAATKAWR